MRTQPDASNRDFMAGLCGESTKAFLDYVFDNPRLFELMFLTKREGARQYPEDLRTRRKILPWM